VEPPTSTTQQQQNEPIITVEPLNQTQEEEIHQLQMEVVALKQANKRLKIQIGMLRKGRHL